MKIVTKEDYIKSLKDQKVRIYYNGEPVKDRSTHPGFVPAHQLGGQDL